MQQYSKDEKSKALPAKRKQIYAKVGVLDSIAMFALSLIVMSMWNNIFRKQD